MENDEWRYWREIDDAIARRDLPRVAHWVVELLIHRAQLQQELLVIDYDTGRKTTG